MSVNITVGNGQGITQAIKAHLEKQGVKLTNVKLSDWQNVMTLVNQNQQANASGGKDSIFTGGNDVSRIGKNNGDNNWKTDFQVQAGQVMQFDAGIFNKIVAVLTGKAQETPAPQETPEPKPQTPPTLDTKPQGLSQEPDIPDTITLPDGAQRQITEGNIESLGGKIIQREVNGEKQDKVRRAINEDGTLGDTLAATKTIGKNEYITGDFPAGTKILEREVNGQKQQIAVYEDENGNKQRSLVVKDPETGASKLGDNLVAISTFGKNKYITQTEMDNQMRTALGLPQDAQLPEDIKGSYVNIGGEPTLIFKKDGKTLDQAGLKEYINTLKDPIGANRTADGSINAKNTAGEIEGAQETPVTVKAQEPVSPVVTGPSEGENPEYDAAVRGNTTSPAGSTVETKPETKPEAKPETKWDGRPAYGDVSDKQAEANSNVHEFVTKSQMYQDTKSGLITVRGYQSYSISDAHNRAEFSMRVLTENKDKYLDLVKQDPATLTEQDKNLIADFEHRMGVMQIELDSTGNFKNTEDCEFILE